MSAYGSGRGLHTDDFVAHASGWHELCAVRKRRFSSAASTSNGFGCAGRPNSSWCVVLAGSARIVQQPVHAGRFVGSGRPHDVHGMAVGRVVDSARVRAAFGSGRWWGSAQRRRGVEMVRKKDMNDVNGFGLRLTTMP